MLLDSKPCTSLGITLLVVDDQLAVRNGLKQLIVAGIDNLRAVFTASTGAEALACAHREQPDLVLLDVDLAGEDGLALLPALLLGGDARVLVVTSQVDVATRCRALSLGASGVIEKHQPAKQLLATVNSLLRAPVSRTV